MPTTQKAISYQIPDHSPAAANENVTFTAIIGGGHSATESWTGGGSPPTGFGPSFTTSWAEGGVKNVTVIAVGDDPAINGPCSASAGESMSIYKVAFVDPDVVVLWTPTGSYGEASGNLTSDSYNTANLFWELSTAEGDDTVISCYCVVTSP